MMVHSALTRSIPTCLAVIGAACLLAACQPVRNERMEEYGWRAVRFCINNSTIYEHESTGDLVLMQPRDSRFPSYGSEAVGRFDAGVDPSTICQ